MTGTGKRHTVAVILAAGKGTRMHSKAVPKVLQDLCGWPILRYVLRVARALKPEKTVAVVGFGRDQVVKAFEGEDILWAIQEKQLGTAHAAGVGLSGVPDFSGNVVILNGDLPHLRPDTVQALLETHVRTEADGTILVCRKSDPTGYGRIVRDREDRPSDIVEERDASPEIKRINEVNCGVYVFRAPVLRELIGRLRPDNAQGELYLPDAFVLLTAQGGRGETFLLEDDSEIEQISDRADLAASAQRIYGEIARYHMARGVTIVSPEHTFIDQDVEIGHDSVILPFCVIRSSVKIGERCEVGPFSHLRPDVELENGAEVGNFTELKATLLGRDSKAKHLSYLGNGVVGPGVNIGAGTIFANYDGKTKETTHVHEGAFVGSGSILVAPVTVGKGAVTGAGAVVTKRCDVKPGQVVVGMPARPLTKKKPKEPK